MNKIYVIEGLTGEIFGYCRKPLIKAGFEVDWHPWWTQKKIPDGSIVVMHSFGIRYINTMFKNKTEAKLILAIDPRMPLIPALFNPIKVPLTLGGDMYCFYQTGYMRGYPLKTYADVAINIKVEGYRHTALPQYMGIRETIRKYL
jgi:hypothetical protein